MIARRLLVLVLLAPGAWAAEATVPLPPAPVRLVVPDVTAFDAALTGRFRRALLGQPEEGDPILAAWRRSPVGSKLEAQWAKLAGELPWTWDEVLRLKPRSLGLALLDVGALEAVMVVETPLATLPVTLPAGEGKTRGGVAYQLVVRGAGDEGSDPGRRLGLAWTRSGGRLFLATSEHALVLALDEALAGRGIAPVLGGFASLELDLVALGKDRYFRREFLFGETSDQGRILAALRLEEGRVVEVREGKGEAGPPAMAFDAPRAAAAGWEPDGTRLWPALRGGLLEPIPSPSDRPAPPLLPLPPAARASAPDRYMVNMERPPVGPGAPWEEGELASWHALWAKRNVSGWGWTVGARGSRSIVFAWPAAQQEELERLCRATLERRAGPVTVVAVGDARELRVGPGLPALAISRTGEFVWIGPAAAELADARAPRPAPELVRWARVDLRAVRGEAARWEATEGPAAPERLRPLSDRVLGLLGWMPATTSLAVERRRSPGGWTERVVFGTDRP